MRRPGRDTVLSRFLYRFRPDRPEIGSELLHVKNESQKESFTSGQVLHIVSWNTYKGKRPHYTDTLLAYTAGTDLLLLQEFRQMQAFDALHQEIFSQKDALLAVSYFTLQSGLSPTGVCTVSPVKTLQAIVVASRPLEPVMKTPKMALCTWYPLNDSKDIRTALLVLNCHGINFRLRRSFRSHMAQLREQLLEHTGPIIFVGDFNTWEPGREKILDTLADELHLTRIHFPKGIKHVGGHQLDRVYVRGGAANNCTVAVNSQASDHALLAFDFTIE